MKYETYWLTILLLGIGTFLIRCSFIYLSSRLKINDFVKNALSFIPSAIFPALITPMVFFHEGHSSILFTKERLFALLLATVVAYKTRNVLITIISGLGILFALSFT